MGKLSNSEKLFILCMMLCSFAITADASITKAVASSVFLQSYTVKLYPLAWLASVPLNFLIVAFYNRFLPRLGPLRMLLLTVFVGGCVHILSAFYLHQIPHLPFILYLWKDIFIILMFHELWSVIHATIRIANAKYLYGIFFGVGGLGSLAGSMIPGYFATSVGSEKLLLVTLFYYVLIALCYGLALRFREKIETKQDISTMTKHSTDFLGGVGLIRASSFLKFILLITCAMQISSTILDFQFSSFLEKNIPNQDLRTAFLGKLFMGISTLNIFLQFLGSFFLLKWIGLRRAHFAIPLILGANSFLFILIPQFRVLTLGFSSIKSLDYSLFGIIKEMLYIPLKVDEKFKAKAIIDVFAYRSSKAVASLIILSLQTLSWINLNAILSWVLCGIFVIWMASVLLLFKHYDEAVQYQN